MARRYISICFMLVLVTALPQLLQAGWTRTYGGADWDFGFCVRQTPDGGYIICGGTDSFADGAENLYLVRTDANGDTLWTRHYGPEGEYWECYGYTIQPTSDGNYIAVGHIYGDLWLLKLTPNGDTLWTQRLGGEDEEYGYSVAETSDGGYVAVGYTATYSAEYTDDVFLVKTDTAGSFWWRANYGGSDNDGGICVKETSDGGYVIVGYTGSFDHGEDDWSDIWLLKTDNTGDTLWTKTYGGMDEDFGGHVLESADGGYVVIGYTCSFGEGDDDIWLLRTDQNGDTLFTRFYGDAEADEETFFIQETSDGGYIIPGMKYVSEEQWWDLWLIKLDENFDTVWTRTYGGYDDEYMGWAEQTSDGGYIMTGETWSFGHGESDVWLVKTDSLGDTLGTFVIEKPTTEIPTDWQIMTGVGSQIVLRYADQPGGFHADIFDASGRKVDELHSIGVSGTITWGQGHRPGVYFVRPRFGQRCSIKKVILIQ